MLTLNDGRSELWQWDTKRKLTVDADCSQVHFSNKVFGRSNDVDVIDGIAIIPDILLQTDKDLTAWAFVGTAENGYTKISKTFKVNKRNKPADYVFTPPEQTSLEEIKEKIEYLESIQDPDAIKNAVEDYLEQNPVDAPVQSVNGKTGKVLLTALDVGAISQDDLQEATNKALAQAKESGVFDGPKGDDYVLTTADKEEIAEMAADLVEVPDSGGNVELDTTLTQSGKAADAKAVGDKIAEITGISLVEPADDDIPKVYFTGTLPTSKTEDGERLTMHYISKTADFIYPVTLNVQGSSSTGYPKKNFTLKPYKDSTYEKKQKLVFKNWPEMNKFVLKAHWIDHSHVRNVGTAKIWGKIVKSRSDYGSLPEELRNAPNNGATDGFTVKVFCNGVYQGLYEWIVPKDKLFGQDKDIATHSILNSEYNNQPTCAFATTTPTINGNWSEELQDTMNADTKTSIENWIKFVAGSTDEEFVANAENYFDVLSVIDADIFDRVFCTVDNLCRNQTVFKYDSKWFVGKWDLDAVLGLPPVAGGSFFAYDTEYQTGYLAYKNYGITNLLYQRVENLFLDRFKARYAELRSDVLSIENILDVYERLTDVIATYDGLLAEDFASTTGSGAFTGIPYTSENNIQQIRAFVSQRIPYMDEVIENMTGETGGGEVEPDIPDEPDQPDTPVTYGNLISVSDFKNAYINYNTGAFVSDASGNMISTETYIEVVPGVTYIADCFADGIMESAQVGVRYYDANKTYTKDYFGADGIYCPKTFTVPTDKNIKYARLQFVLNGAFNNDSFSGVSVLLYRADDPLRCDSITLSETVLTLDGATTHKLNATVSPDGCFDRVLWSSSSPAVAKVSNGVVTTVGNGETVITATCGEYSATCTVVVTNIGSDVNGEQIPLEAGFTEKSYINGNTGNMDSGGQMVAAYNDFVSVEADAKYMFVTESENIAKTQMVYFNAGKTVISYLADYNVGKEFTIPQNCAYMKFHVASSGSSVPVGEVTSGNFRLYKMA